MDENIEVLGLKELKARNLIATGSIMINGMIIHQMRIIQTSSGPKVVAPSIHWENEEGHFFKEIVVFDNDLMDRIEIEMIKEYWIRFATGPLCIYE